MVNTLETETPGPQRISGHGGNAPGQGPFLTLHLLIGGDRILGAEYETYQCPGCVACGKAIVDLVQGHSIETVRQLKWDDLVKVVGPLPRYRSHCYSLALLALTDALRKLGPKDF